MDAESCAPFDGHVRVICGVVLVGTQGAIGIVVVRETAHICSPRMFRLLEEIAASC